MLPSSVAAPLLPPAPSDAWEPPPPDALAAGAAARTKRAAPAAPAAAARPGDPLGFAGLGACVDDVREAALARGDGPRDPPGFAALRARVAAAAERLPAAHREGVAEPLLRTLDELGPKGYAALLRDDPERQAGARLLLDLAQAVLQRGEGHAPRATAAFQEVVSDLYEGFLSAGDRRGVKPPDHGVLAPIVRWGSAESGPYTWPVTATRVAGAKAALVSLPAANATRGLLAWPALAHETAGHDVLEADAGLEAELAAKVRDALLAERAGLAVADYWAARIPETASDVLGILSMGPAAAAGLVGYFRGVNEARAGRASLRNVGRKEDPHPADLARAYVAAETVRLLGFSGARAWADRLVAEADRDLGQLRLGDAALSPAAAKAAAAVVASTIVQARMKALEGHALGEIQGWTDRDEAIVARLRGAMPGGGAAAARALPPGAYAAHVVAAAVYDALAGTATPGAAMDRMIATLAAMNAKDHPLPPRRPGGPPAAPAPSLERVLAEERLGRAAAAGPGRCRGGGPLA